ncbi:MAG: ABC transporter permease [Thermomicrobiales bacterium]|nr:ABC transporter permease [Thermomicrobiales bacterium]
MLRALMQTRAGRIGFIVVAIYVLAAVIGPYVVPHSTTELDFTALLHGPSSNHWFGTDQFGRDVFSRVVSGARRTLLLAVAATAVGVIGGTAWGLTAGYYGKWVDELLMRIVDGLMSFPSLLLALLIVTTLGSSASTVLAAIGVVFIPRVARIVRAATLDVRTQEYIEAARLRGESGLHILFREILPNVSAPVTVESAIRLSYAILLTTSLSFLGLGAQPPTPDWGLMVAEARDFIDQAPWMVIFPALAISFLVVGANLLADGIRDVLNYGGEEASS